MKRLISLLLLLGFGLRFLLFSIQAFAVPASQTTFIKLDQFGYLTDAQKVAVISDPVIGYNSNLSFVPGSTYQVRRWSDDSVVYRGSRTSWNRGQVHAQSGDRGWWFDFSSLTQPGSYYVYDLQNQLGSGRFEINDDVYDRVLNQALRMYFYQRVNYPKQPPYADPRWSDGSAYNAANQDYYATDINDRNNTSTARNLSGGWYDAGDTNKYTTFTFDTLIQLLEAYRFNPDVFSDGSNIPESGNGIADILDEIRWEMHWLRRMQNATGTNGLMLKVGVDDYQDVSPPSSDTRPRYYVGECSSSTIVGAAVFALASSVYSKLGHADMNTLARSWRWRAQTAWRRAKQVTNNFTDFQTNCDNLIVKSGDADRTSQEQFEQAVVAAIYLFEATGLQEYHDFIINHYNAIRPLSEYWWGPYRLPNALALLRYARLPGANAQIASEIIAQKSSMNYLNSVDAYNANTDLYRAQMDDSAHHWGSNMIRANNGNINLNFNSFAVNPSHKNTYKNIAAQYLHWLHGVNPMGKVMLTNMYEFGAEDSANEMYHTWFANASVYDNAQTSSKGPAPGYMVGGPNVNYSVTTISPPYGQPPQKSFLDFNNGYPENSWEITEPGIYYQSSYILLLSRLMKRSPSGIDYGKPVIDRSVDNGIFLWRSGSRSWIGELVSANGPRRIGISVNSDQLISNVQQVSIEPNDVFIIKPKALQFKLNISPPWMDGFRFTVANQTGTCFKSWSSMPVYLGKNRILLNSSFDMKTLGVCQ